MTSARPKRPPRGLRLVIAAGVAAAALLFPGIPALAQDDGPTVTEELRVFLEGVRSHPGARAAEAALQAAGYQLDAAWDPVQFELSGAYTSLDVDSDFLERMELLRQTPPEMLPDGVDLEDIPADFVSDGAVMNASLTFRPFPYGDFADLVDQRQFALLLSRLDYQESLAGLEAQAISLALSNQLASRGVELAGQALELSEEALQVARTRFERGAATERDVREAQAGLLEAQTALTDAEADLELARNSLRSLVGDVPVPDLAGLNLGIPTATPLSVQRSAIQARQAELGVRGARRNMIPVAQAGYTLNVSDEASVEFAIESRTLQPSVSYNFQPQLGPVYGESAAQALADNPVQGSFHIGVSVSLSPGDRDELRAAELQAQAAQSGYEAAVQRAQLEFDSLVAALEESIRAEEVAAVRLHNAQLALEEAQVQLDAGVGIPLEVQSTALELSQAHLNHASTRQQVVQNILAFYEFYGIPLSEALL